MRTLQYLVTMASLRNLRAGKMTNIAENIFLQKAVRQESTYMNIKCFFDVILLQDVTPGPNVSQNELSVTRVQTL